MTGTGTQTQMQTWTTGVTTIALLVLRTGELKIGRGSRGPLRGAAYAPLWVQGNTLVGGQGANPRKLLDFSKSEPPKTLLDCSIFLNENSKKILNCSCIYLLTVLLKFKITCNTSASIQSPMYMFVCMNIISLF